MGNRSGHELMIREMPLQVQQLHCAVMRNDADVVVRLIKEGVNVNFPWYNPNSPGIKDGCTPLICAVSLNHMDIIKILICSGAYINKCDRNGCTPVYKAAFHGRPTLIEMLAKAGADVNLADYHGKTPLYYCVNNAIVHTHSSKLAVRKLLQGGAIVDKSDKAGQAPVHVASHWKLVDILGILIGEKSDINLTDKRGRTPLYVCVCNLSTKLYAEDLKHQLPCILMLFKHGADMLNLCEWILVKGPGIPKELLMDTPKPFQLWYKQQTSKPQTLSNICRKMVQMTLVKAGLGSPVISGMITSHGSVRDNGLVTKTKKLPLPESLQKFVARKMFFHIHPHPQYLNS